jgi:hypothetical protein
VAQTGKGAPVPLTKLAGSVDSEFLETAFGAAYTDHPAMLRCRRD